MKNYKSRNSLERCARKDEVEGVCGEVKGHNKALHAMSRSADQSQHIERMSQQLTY